jgi:hypothetical protein
MTLKQKAEEIIEKYLPYAHILNPEGELRHSLHLENAKKCAIICCDEILESQDHLFKDGISKQKYVDGR